MASDYLIYSIELGNGHCARRIPFYVTKIYLIVISIIECFTKAAEVINLKNVVYVKRIGVAPVSREQKTTPSIFQYSTKKSKLIHVNT